MINRRRANDNNAFGRQIARMLQQDFQDSRAVTLEDHERRGKLSQFLEKMVTLFAWFMLGRPWERECLCIRISHMCNPKPAWD